MENCKDTTNVLDQYRELLRQNGATVAAHTAPAIERARKDAETILLTDTDLVVPNRGSEGYAYTDLRAMLAPDLGLNIIRHRTGVAAERALKCGLPNVTPFLAVWANDIFCPNEKMNRLLPPGVTVTSFSDATPEQAEIIRKYYSKIADGRDAVTVLNTALAQDGVLVHIARGVVIERPIQLVNILQNLVNPNDGKTLSIMAVRRLLVVLDEGAQASIMVCDHDNTDDNVSLSTRVSEIHLGRNAALDFYDLEEGRGNSSRYCSTVVRQKADSRLNMLGCTLKTGRARNDYDVHLDEPGASLTLDGMVIVDNDQLADNNVTVHHHAPRCHSNQRFKYLVSDEAKGSFEGLIRVDHGAVGTEAFQTNRNMVAGEKARMHSQPQLEIYCDDVKCSHGSATGQLDEQALFYMRSRGIDLPEAMSMLMNAFMADVIDEVRLAPLRDRLRYLVERRLKGDDARCENCK